MLTISGVGDSPSGNRRKERVVKPRSLTLPATYSPLEGSVHPLRRFGHAALLHQQLQTEQQIEIKRGDGFLHERQRGVQARRT